MSELTALRRMGGNAAWSMSTLVVGLAGAVVVTGVAVREVGAADFGLFALTMTVAGLLLVLEPCLGLGVSRAVARGEAAGAVDRGPEIAFLRAANGAYVGLAALSVVGVLGLVVAVPAILAGRDVDPVRSRHVVLVIGVSLVVQLATGLWPAAFIGRADFRTLFFATAAGSAANLCVVLVLIGRLGVIAVAWGQLALVVVSRLALLPGLRGSRSWFPLRPARPRRSDLRQLVAFSGPLVVLTLGAQLVTTTDLVSIGRLVSAEAVGLYRIGGQLPNQLIALLYRGYDVVYPQFAADPDPQSQERMLALLTRLAGVVAGVSFGALVAVRHDVVLLLSGSEPALAVDVLVVFSAVWLCNVPVHGLALLLIARQRHRVFLPLVAVEAIANLVLTVVFVDRYGALGAATATLVTLLVSNVVILPLLVRSELHISVPRLVLLDGALATVVGSAIGLATGLPFRGMSPGLVRLAAVGSVSVLALVGCGALVAGAEGRRRLATRPMSDLAAEPLGEAPQ